MEKYSLLSQYARCASTSWCQTMERSHMKNTYVEATSLVPAWRRDEALVAMDGNSDLLVKVAGLLIKQLDADLPLIRQYVQAKESVPLQNRSHRLKGSLSAIAATPAFTACNALNELAAQTQTQGYADGLERLEAEVARLRPHLNRVISKPIS